MYCLNMLNVALELAVEDPVYEDIASKFWEHFLSVAYAMHGGSRGSISLWDEGDGFFYDVMRLPNGEQHLIKVRSMLGLIPLFAVINTSTDVLDRFPGFTRRREWFLANRPELTDNISIITDGCQRERVLLSVVKPDQLRRVLRIMLDENEFLSPYGIRSVSRIHQEQPYVVQVNGAEYCLEYEPGQSHSRLLGGNSNWRGPVWMPVNYLLIESLQRFHYYFGDDYKVECPTGSGQLKTLDEVAVELARRVISILLPDHHSRRPVYGGCELFQHDPYWKDLVLF